ncbi:MAG: hypothetical protein M1834_003165 [Cirrosporium novae-zelandiae]|nr:MAG: hypothetical protein M1834_003165 [Cirrosporium novae-zelandiae]
MEKQPTIAGVTDSPLTNHGVLQATRLGEYFSRLGLTFTHIFTSDLQRAVKTSQIIQNTKPPRSVSPAVEVCLNPIQLPILREKDFGSYEGKSFRALKMYPKVKEGLCDEHQNEKGFKDIESKEKMIARMETFLTQHLYPVLDGEQKMNQKTVAVVSHGEILSVLWRCLLGRVGPKNISLAPGINIRREGIPLEYIATWSNTGYLEADIHTSTILVPNSKSKGIVTEKEIEPDTSDQNPESLLEGKSASVGIHTHCMTIKTINCKDHLKGVKRTGGGVGSSQYDGSQKKIESFFKKKQTS